MEAIADVPLVTPKYKKVKKHSLNPQIFLQLELSSPQAKSIDPSKVGVLSNGWRDHPSRREDGSDNFVTHVRVEHCNALPEEREIRNEDPYGGIIQLPDLEEDPSAADPYDSLEDYEYEYASTELKTSEETTMTPSPTSVRTLGRHDHLLEPLPNELFSNHDMPQMSTPIVDEERKITVHPKSATNREGEEVADVRGSCLNLFADIDMDAEDEEDEITQKPKRKNSKTKQLRRTTSLRVLEEPETKKDEPKLVRRASRRRSVGAESRPRSKSGSRKNSSLSRSNHREQKSTSRSGSRRPDTEGSAPGTPRRHRSAVSCTFQETGRLSKSEEFVVPSDKLTRRRSSLHSSTTTYDSTKSRSHSSAERRSKYRSSPRQSSSHQIDNTQ
jgi:hypothetical protein